MSQIVREENLKSYISSAATTQVATGPGVLHAIVVGETSGSLIAVIDGTTGTTANIATLKASIAEGTYTFDASFDTGLRIVTGASKITVVYTTK